MIKYDRFWVTMKERGITQYDLYEHYQITRSLLDRLRKNKNVEISIIMGSDSDLNIMVECFKILDEFEISYDINILSAHRTPEELDNYIDKVNKENIKIVIAVAGGAAHLAGVIASKILCPVIGVPIYTKSLNGIDSLYSTIQMPSGVPVATVGINASKNAGLLAIKMLGLENLKIKEKLIHYNQMQANKVINKNKKIHDLGYEKYLEEMRNESKNI